MGNRPGKKWPLLSSLLIILLIASYCLYEQSVYPPTRALFIIGYGVLCATAVLFLALYILRKNVYSYRLGSREGWLQAHVYIGIISILLIFMHVRFRPGGTFGLLLVSLFLLVIINGIIGSLIYRFIPVALSRSGRNVESGEEIKGSLESCLKEADAAVSNSSEKFRHIYDRKIRPLIASKRTRWEYLFTDEMDLFDERRGMMDSYRAVLPARDIHDMDVVSSILLEKEKLSLLQARLKIQSAWLTLHLPLTTALLAAVIIHIVVILYY